MKVQILTLDAHDDRNSVLDRLGWVQASRVVLVWPPDGSPLRSQLDLALVQRKAFSRHVQLGLVTHDPEVRKAARTLKIPVFASADSLPERDWRRRGTPPLPGLRRAPRPASLDDLRPSPKTAAPTSPAARVGRPVAIALALAAVAAVPIATVPSAEVILSPALTQQRAQVDLVLSAEGVGSPGERLVPAEWRTMRVAGEIRIPTSGSILVPAGYAAGNVTFTNLTSETVSLPSGTGLRSQGDRVARFVTTEDAQLPAASGATVEVPVAAVEPGSGGNVAAGDISAVEGELGLRVEVSNAAPTTGGSEADRAAVSAVDPQEAYQALLADLQSQAGEALLGDLLAGEALVQDSLHVTNELRRTYDAQVGEAADTLALALDVEIAALVYRQDALEEAALAVLEQDEPGLETVPGSTVVHILDGPTTDRRGRTTVRLEARRQAASPLDPSAAAAGIAGRPLESAQEWLAETTDLRQPATILLRPTFLPWLPLLPFRISVRADWESAP